MKRIIFALALLVSAPALAFDIPALKGPVNDYAKLLTADQASKLDKGLRAIEADSKDGAQVVVLTIPSLADESIDKVRSDVFHAWKLGQAGKDNGLLLIIAPVERKIGIEVGYGLEAVLPDGLTKSITEDKIKPHLKKGSEDWFKAIDSGTQAIGAVILRRETAAAPPAQTVSIFWPVTLMGCAAAGVGFMLVGASRRRSRRQEEEALAAAALRRSSNPYTPRRSNVAAAAAGAGAGYAAAKSRPPAPAPTPRPASRSSSYDSSPSYSSGGSWSSSSSGDSGSSSYSGGGGDSGGGGSSSDF